MALLNAEQSPFISFLQFPLNVHETEPSLLPEVHSAVIQQCH